MIKNLLSAAVIAASALVALPNIASAQQVGVTFEFEGATWYVRNFSGASPQMLDKFRNAPPTRNMMTSGFGNICKNRVIDLQKVANTTGGKDIAMTPEQKFRGDGRFHVVCAWGAQPPRVAEAPAAPPAPVAVAPVAPPPVAQAPQAQPPAVQPAPAPQSLQRDVQREYGIIDAKWRGKGEKI